MDACINFNAVDLFIHYCIECMWRSLGQSRPFTKIGGLLMDGGCRRWRTQEEIRAEHPNKREGGSCLWDRERTERSFACWCLAREKLPGAFKGDGIKQVPLCGWWCSVEYGMWDPSWSSCCVDGMAHVKTHMPCDEWISIPTFMDGWNFGNCSRFVATIVGYNTAIPINIELSLTICDLHIVVDMKHNGIKCEWFWIGWCADRWGFIFVICQGLDIRGRIYVNEQGFNAQVLLTVWLMIFFFSHSIWCKNSFLHSMT